MYLQLSGYGKKISTWSTGEIKRDNALRTGEITWDLDITSKYEIASDNPLGSVITKSSFEPNKKWLQNSYGEIPFIKTEELSPHFSIDAKYTFYNKDGWLKEGTVELNEIVHSGLLYHKMKYIIEEIE